MPVFTVKAQLFYFEPSCSICQRNTIQDLLNVMSLVERKLCQQGEGEIGCLQPVLDVIGSVAERTRIGLPDELDITVTFTLLNEAMFAVRGDRADGLGVTSLGRQRLESLGLSRVLDRDGHGLNVTCLMEAFLEGVQKALDGCREELPDTVSLPESQGFVKDCDNCIQTSRIEGAWKHCRDVRHASRVCQSRRGAVVILLWRHRETKYTCTVDLVPLLPVPERDLASLYSLVARNEFPAVKTALP